VRHLLSRKTWFYRVLLPLLGRLGPERADRVLARLSSAVAPRARLVERLGAVDAGWDLQEAAGALAANLLRFEARDYPLSGLSDDQALGRFEVEGADLLAEAMDGPCGPILLGSHFGAYLAALHWLRRSRVPSRLLVQRPHHVSAELAAMFEEGIGTSWPQPEFFLKRRMRPGEGARKVWLARGAMKAGMAVYVNGDVAWPSGCARPGALLGTRRLFMAAWADLAAMTGAPVVPVLARHLPGGRFAVEFHEPWWVEPGGEGEAVARYLAMLESAIVEHPGEAVAHLTWPSFTGPGIGSGRPEPTRVG
jgi:hypothetical protein